MLQADGVGGWTSGMIRIVYVMRLQTGIILEV